ncbi:hypothetical protein O6H91_09G058900 [Diphasiastrum complanatum]|uniref:Uncharacterized protein n=1 Tax=Diphasiastrum complanatum TaxID=34168 RepID=A0ACC2CPI7_DIPCM|nr:hypothetical protein O6H91_09G058900 [Diphasiastrum complanatum]
MELLVGAMLGILGLLLWISFLQKTAQKGNLPPGSMGWPLLGKTVEFSLALSSKTPDSFIEKHRKVYGDLFKTHLFGHPTIISLDPQVNKFVLQNEGRYFTASYPKSFVDLFGKNSMLAATGEMHKSQRNATLNFLYSKNSRQKHISDVESYLHMAMSSWRDRVVLVEPEAKKFAFCVIMNTLLSLSWGEELKQMMSDFHLLLEGSLSVRLTLVPCSAYRKAIKARKNLVEKLHSIAEKRRKEKESSHDDMLQFLLLRSNAEGKDQPFSDEELVDQMIFLLSAGHDTVASAITSTVNLLMQFPESLTQLRDEHFSILKCKQPGQPLSWDDYKSMQFTQQVVNEVLRMTNVGFGVFRTAIEDIQIKGYAIPKGWKFLTYLRSAHLQDENYPEPTRFNPWRWQDQNKVNVAFMPFGDGKRKCVGSEFARLELSIFIHFLVTRFRSWELVEHDYIRYFPIPHTGKGFPIKLENF